MIGEMCARCGAPALGYATINDRRYCHGDDEPTCYTEAQWEASQRAFERNFVRWREVLDWLGEYDGRH